MHVIRHLKKNGIKQVHLGVHLGHFTSHHNGIQTVSHFPYCCGRFCLSFLRRIIGWFTYSDLVNQLKHNSQKCSCLTTINGFTTPKISKISSKMVINKEIDIYFSLLFIVLLYFVSTSQRFWWSQTNYGVLQQKGTQR